MTERADSNLRRWIELTEQKLNDPESEQAVERAVEARTVRAWRQ